MTARTYNISGPDGIGQDRVTVEQAVIAAAQIAIEYGKATISSPHWPDNQGFEITHDDVTRETDTRFIQFGIEEMDYNVDKGND